MVKKYQKKYWKLVHTLSVFTIYYCNTIYKTTDLGIFDFLRRKDNSSDSEKRSIYGQTILGNTFGNASGP